MSKIFFCGDTHGQFQHVIDAVKSHRPDAIILLGDVQAKRPIHEELQDILEMTEIWFIHGNHDTDSDEDYDNLFNSELKDRNLHGRIVEIAGYRVAGLGGIFRGQVWMPPTLPKIASESDYLRLGGKGNLWRGGISRKHRSTIFPADYNLLLGKTADILVTHEAPSCHPHGFRVIDELARSMGVKRSYHGHHHDSIDYRSQYKNLGFECYGVALRGIFVGTT